MNILKLSAEDILAMQHVRRWHMVRVRRDQTLAEHSATVAMYALQLAYLWRPAEAVGLAGAILDLALTHDSHEVEYGDTPSPAVDPQAHDAGVDRFWQKRGIEVTAPRGEGEKFIHQIVDLADKLEAALFYRLEGENSLFRDGTLRKVQDRLVDAPTAVREWVTSFITAVDRGVFTPQPSKVTGTFVKDHLGGVLTHEQSPVPAKVYDVASAYPATADQGIAYLQHRIGEWADQVFPDRTVTETIGKLILEEIPEFLHGVNRHGELVGMDGDEYADLIILVLDVAYQRGIDVNEALRKKMQVNEARTWAKDPDTGHYHHVRGAVPNDGKQ